MDRDTFWRQLNLLAILDLYEKRETVEKESFLASFADLEKNDFNLNIPRYVDNFKEEEQINLDDLLSEMRQTDTEIESVQRELVSLLHDLTCDDEKIAGLLYEYIQMIEG